MQRPDLSFITKQQFENFKDFQKFCEECTDEEVSIISKALTKLPEILQVVEMHHDQNMNKPTSMNFTIVSSLLKNIKNGLQSS